MLENTENLSADSFLHYAGHVKIFSDNKVINELSGFVEDRLINKVYRDQFNKGEITFSKEVLLDLKPGDKLREGHVIHGVGRNIYSSHHIKEASVSFWEEYGVFPYKNQSRVSTDQELSLALKVFLSEFKNYVEDSIERKDFRLGVLEAKVILEIQGISRQEISFSNYLDEDRIDLHVLWKPLVAEKILNGDMNFEGSYIGGLGEFSVNPKDLNNGDVIRWLTMFGYIWENRLSKILLK